MTVPIRDIDDYEDAWRADSDEQAARALERREERRHPRPEPEEHDRDRHPFD